jgi:ferric-dicitrate binding protein FerR (iron transport regulator)
MKKISTWLLFVGLLVIGTSEIYHYTYVRQHYQQSATASANFKFASSLRGQQKKVSLPDGSTVWLNASSTLRYSANMTSGDRVVELFGEAYFDVASKPFQPFKVQAREMMIDVLGTQFNVRNYTDENCTRAAVVTGAIRISYHDQTATLRSGEEVDIDPTELDRQAFTVRKGMDTAAAAAWMRGLLTIDDLDLRGLLLELSRSYNVDIQFNGPVSNHRFQGTFSLQEPLEAVLQRVVVPHVHVTILRPSPQLLIISAKS